MGSNISSKALIGENCQIGEFAIIHDNVIIGDNSTVENFSIVGRPTPLAKKEVLQIGPHATIRSHSVLYAGSTIGEHFTTGHGVVIRENSEIGRSVQIGNYSEVQGDCNIDDYSRAHSSVHIGKGTSIGKFVWLFPRVQFSHDPLPPSHINIPIHISDGCVICTGCYLLAGASMELGSIVGANSVLSTNISPAMFAKGNPAKELFKINKLFNREHGLTYPWMSRFKDRYPEVAHADLDILQERIKSALRM